MYSINSQQLDDLPSSMNRNNNKRNIPMYSGAKKTIFNKSSGYGNNNNNNNNKTNNNKNNNNDVKNLEDSNLTDTTSQENMSNKQMPIRRLAALQTLRLAIPKPPQEMATIIPSAFKSTPTQFSPSAKSMAKHNSNVARSASPLESHLMPNVSYETTSPCCSIYTPSSASTLGDADDHNLTCMKYMGLRKPSIHLNSCDMPNSNDVFDLSPALHRECSPIYEEISINMPNKTSSRSAESSLKRLLSLNSNNLCSYNNNFIQNFV